MFRYSLISGSEKVSFREEFLPWLAKKLDSLFPGETGGTLNIAFLDDAQIQELNLTYRSIDKTTDVLSFHYFEDFSELDEEEIAGEIILSEAKLLSQAEEYKETTEAEFCKLVIHSSLHILGFDHENDEDYKEMRSYEKEIEEALQKEYTIVIAS